jgi:hypothetical protein
MARRGAFELKAAIEVFACLRHETEASLGPVTDGTSLI